VAGAAAQAARNEDASLVRAIAPYRKAFVSDPGHFYSGINALTLSMLRGHLGGHGEPAAVQELAAGVRWAVASALERSPQDYWALATRAELSTLFEQSDLVAQHWSAAVAAADGDWFQLDSSRQTLTVQAELGFRPELAALALRLVEDEIAQLRRPFEPRQVLLFSGHRVDAPSRPVPRFPAQKVAAAEAAIGAALDALGAGAEDLAMTQGAGGGDLIFTEQCQQRGVHVQWMQPLAEAEFIQASVLSCADAEQWQARYFKALDRMKAAPPLCMPVELGLPPKGTNEWERGNRWLLNTALAFGPDKARMVCMWDGGGGDGPGGTRYMYDEVRRRTGRVSWVDTRTL
jgi:hypothetical protein